MGAACSLAVPNGAGLCAFPRGAPWRMGVGGARIAAASASTLRSWALSRLTRSCSTLRFSAQGLFANIVC
eukprot:CAMPEP_0173402698 /NCGR_PEP_ID=MMETSP1356-20130122/54714_1 /TAXON_ID=77927 ORGANISM="Hemiselmis virescens, Strain PCC157" /NCGR_SAMPLE_ID=MMETSP1356 /ASSEMBLY_ACC=CAM_ASM_000847 /LENGTH=69 /DNA_ID=CAMNT_0014363087 /DNA_START=6 /DNA_END=215 /DNA_ORIENTATION=+